MDTSHPPRGRFRARLAVAVLTVLGLSSLGSGQAAAQTIVFTKNGQAVNSWKPGETITVHISGGNRNATSVQIHWQNGNAGAWPVPIAVLPYNPARGLTYTFVANFPTAVSITAQVKFGPGFNQWITMRTIWRRS